MKSKPVDPEAPKLPELVTDLAAGLIKSSIKLSGEEPIVWVLLKAPTLLKGALLFEVDVDSLKPAEAASFTPLKFSG